MVGIEEISVINGVFLRSKTQFSLDLQETVQQSPTLKNFRKFFELSPSFLAI
jgi:hypothetical protein